MRITTRFFAILRERAGTNELLLDLRDGARVSDALEALSARLSSVRDFLPRVACAINQQYASVDAELHDGDELALIPPVSGG
jgi:molybdopterin converting factor subunit 1